MQWFKWGCQENVFGLPLSLALIIGAVGNTLTQVREFPFVLNTRHSFLSLASTATYVSERWDAVRLYVLALVVVRLAWGVSSLAAIFLDPRPEHFRRIVYLVVLSYVLSGGEYVICLAAFFMPGRLAENALAFRAWKVMQRGEDILPWPARFWVVYVFNLICSLMFFVISADLCLSLANVLEAGGSGWEGRNAVQLKKAAVRAAVREAEEAQAAAAQERQRRLAERAALLADMV